MKINYYNQPEDIKLGDVLTKRLGEKFDKVWIVSGFSKDSGIEALIPALEKSKIPEVNIHLGLDKKNTSKDVLLKVLKTGANLRIFLNGNDDKTETRIYLFFKQKGNSYVYLTAGKLSEGGLFENSCLITEIIYEKEELIELFNLVQKIESDSNFKVTDENDILELAANGEIMARITERKIPRIAELYQQGEVEIGGAKQYDETVGIGTNAQEYDDVDIAVELPKE